MTIQENSCRITKKLVLHVDLNNTILVSDAVTAQGTVAALDYYLTTVTWGRMNPKGKWEWLSDAPSLLPPCEGAVSYYSQFGRTPGFTSSAGRCFRGILDEHLGLLRWPEGLSVKGEDGQLYHWILPSFFQLLKDLVQEGREFAVLFRTFGTDLPRVLSAVSRALNEGAHPLFPDLVNTTPGKIRCSKNSVVLSRAQERVSARDGERGLYQYLSSVQGLGGFQDHFDWWARNSFSIHGGKPLWVDPFDQDVQHIFIDDNIRQNDDDTIVQPLVFLDPHGTETRTACTSELYDITLIQNDLLRAISDTSYFTQRINICQENYERNLQQGTG
uniref:Si:dkey-32e6.3 n=1 Tax=Sphaeramia orbicularis TaxID=375764 RepID=A0A673CQI6_9TELE